MVTECEIYKLKFLLAHRSLISEFVPHQIFSSALDAHKCMGMKDSGSGRDLMHSLLHLLELEMRSKHFLPGSSGINC